MKIILINHSFLEPRDIKRNDRFIQYGLNSCKNGYRRCRIRTNLTEEDKLRVGVSVGSGIGGLETIYNGSLTINSKDNKKLSPFFIPSSLVNLIIWSNFYKIWL